MMPLAPAKATFTVVAVHLALLLVTIAHAAEEDSEESGIGIHGGSVDQRHPTIRQPHRPR